MADLIERQAAIDAFAKQLNVDDDRVYKNGTRREYAIGYGGIKRVLESMTSAQPIEPERKKGKWMHDKDDLLYSGYCSRCGWTAVIMETDVADMPFCPNCGADMRGKT